MGEVGSIYTTGIEKYLALKGGAFDDGKFIGSTLFVRPL